jgi:hypothetical protein
MRGEIKLSTLETIANILFVENAHAFHCSPRSLVDPSSNIAQNLLDSGDAWLPNQDSDLNSRISLSLSQLGLFITSLDTSLIEYVALKVTDQSLPVEWRHALSCKLIALIDQERVVEERLPSLSITSSWLPADNGDLYPANQLFYNDSGRTLNDTQHNLPSNFHATHSIITPYVVSLFHIETASNLRLLHGSDAIDATPMGENFTDRVRNLLKDYPPESILLEFLANAADAGATTFAITLDERPGKSDHIYSRSLAKWQTKPSLVIYNDSVFSDDDFAGIRKTGVGGKKDKPEKIGRFGIGSISMYHYTEVSLITIHHFLLHQT